MTGKQMTVEQSVYAKLQKFGFSLRESEFIVGAPRSRKGAAARHALKIGQGKKLVGGLYK
jgi:hypothetical protein